jgi:hypothetical protein
VAGEQQRPQIVDQPGDRLARGQRVPAPLLPPPAQQIFVGRAERVDDGAQAVEPVLPCSLGNDANLSGGTAPARFAGR